MEIGFSLRGGNKWINAARDGTGFLPAGREWVSVTRDENGFFFPCGEEMV